MSAPRTERTRYAWRYSCSQERPTCNTSHAAARVMVIVRARGDPGRGAHSAAAAASRKYGRGRGGVHGAASSAGAPYRTPMYIDLHAHHRTWNLRFLP